MARTSYLRVYEPLSAFPAAEREQWLASSVEVEAGEPDALAMKGFGRWLITGVLPHEELVHGTTEGAFIRTWHGQTVVCPWRTRLRALAGLLAFRESVPEEVADAFVPASEAQRAANELAALDERQPDMRSYMLHANWHVPLRWFVAFDPSERILVEDKDGLRIRYETSVGDARDRLHKVVSVLDRSWPDDGVVIAVKDLRGWLETFGDDALLELDYGSIAAMLDDDELIEANCAAEVWSCVDAVGAGDGLTAGKTFEHLSNRWALVRAHELMN
jgi:hypothetical protein